MLAELREWLGLEDKYKNSKDFRKYVVEPASKELKNRADIWFEIEKPIKESRTVIGYVVRIYKKSKNIEQDRVIKNNIINKNKYKTTRLIKRISSN